LFGPNSSGKSAIYDALKLADELFTLPRYQRKTKEIAYSGHTWRAEDRLDESSPIIKNWRRTSPLSSIESLQDKMTLGVTFDVSPLNWFSYPTKPEDFPSFDLKNIEGLKTLEISLLSTFRYVKYEEGDRYDPGLFLHRDFELTIGRVVMASYCSEEFLFRINLAHPLFKYTGDHNELLSFNLTDERKYTISIDKNWLDIKSSGYLLINDYLQLWNDRQNMPFDIAAPDGAGEIQRLYNQIIGTIMKSASFLPELVDASRRVPTQADLSYNITSDYSSEHDQSIVESYGLTRSGDDQFKQLAVSCAMNLPDYADKQDSEADILKTVNRFLSDYLFIDRGYQLGFDYAVVMKSSQYRELAEDWENFYLWVYELLIKIHLLDSNGVKLDFSDVGSGLGYSLPVLIAVAEHRNSLLVQQPELHLHPALQASMADVFIDSLDNDGALIVETHSEHLILRILRRIRQSNLSPSQNHQLAISAKQVTVLYFDSLPDSSTSIKSIRISEGGEFLDKWPHGFFEERDKELFDE